MWLYYFLLMWLGGMSIALKSTLNVCSDKISNIYSKDSIFCIKRKKLYLFICYLPLMLICAMRSINIGNDTITYHQLYKAAIDTTWEQYYSIKKNRWETGYLLLNKVLSNICESPQLIIAFSSVISIYLVIRFINNYSKNPYMSIFLFITMRFYVFYMSNIRQSIAMSVILLSYEFIIKKKIISFIFCVFLASQFHSTAIIFMIAYPILNYKYSRNMIRLLITISAFIFMFFNSIMNIITKYGPGKYSNYINTTYFLDSTNLANILNFIVAFIVCIFGIYIIKKTRFMNVKNDARYIYILILSASLALISVKFSMISRVQYYFYIFSIIIIPNIVNYVNEKKSKKMVTFIIFSCFFLYFTIIMIFRPEWQHVYPYEFFFDTLNTL